MTLVPIERGLFYPPFEHPIGGSVGTLDLATEKYAMIGHLYFNGRPTGAKTLSTGTIQWRAGTSVWAATAPASVMDVGLQGVASSGPMARPNGTYTVKKTLTSPVGVTTASWITTTMDTGSASLTHGDFIAVVWDMTARNGSDSVQVNAQIPPYVSNLQSQLPMTNAYLAGAWGTTGTTGNIQRWPDVVIVTDDGTMGTIAPTVPWNSTSSELFTSATNPDERGLVFQVPFNCTIDGLWAFAGMTDTNTWFNLKLYSSPTAATPTSLGSVAQFGYQMSAAGAESIVCKPIPPVNLTKNTDYLVTLESFGTSNVRLVSFTVGHTDHRAFWPGGTTLKKGSRQNATGAFAIESPAVTLYRMGVIISHIDVNTGSPTYSVGV